MNKILLLISLMILASCAKPNSNTLCWSDVPDGHSYAYDELPKGFTGTCYPAIYVYPRVLV